MTQHAPIVEQRVRSPSDLKKEDLYIVGIAIESTKDSKPFYIVDGFESFSNSFVLFFKFFILLTMKQIQGKVVEGQIKF
jgi:hypothetical protein